MSQILMDINKEFVNELLDKATAELEKLASLEAAQNQVFTDSVAEEVLDTQHAVATSLTKALAEMYIEIQHYLESPLTKFNTGTLKVLFLLLDQMYEDWYNGDESSD